ncbi:MAG: dihydrodipicolinate synthase family protein [Acidobacteria bacterium]|nr:dihydrodipicolinate synthase family protein [Acidobacteriota bacterium]
MNEKGDGYMLSGSVVPLVTPLTQDEELDKSALGRLVAFHHASGTDGLFLLGTCGEGPCLRDRVKLELVEAVLAQSQGTPILIGVSETASRRAAEWARRVNSPGVELVLMPPTFLFAASKAEHTAHVRCVVDAVGSPVILYNLPGKTGGHSVPLDALELMVQEGLVKGIKDSAGNLEYLRGLLSLRARYPFFRVMNGELTCAGEAVLQGVDGLVMSYTNVDPAGCIAMIRAGKAGDNREVQRLQEKFIAVRRCFPRHAAPAGWVKAILARLDLCRPICCSPVGTVEPTLPDALIGDRNG